jgi:hypothetical protein
VCITPNRFLLKQDFAVEFTQPLLGDQNAASVIGGRSFQAGRLFSCSAIAL